MYNGIKVVKAANKYVGRKVIEVKRGKHPEWLTRFGKLTKRNYTPVSWCAVFVNGILDEAGIRGTGSNKSLKFKSWGRVTKIPRSGDIALWTSSDEKRGHVGVIIKRLGDEYIIIDGASTIRKGAGNTMVKRKRRPKVKRGATWVRYLTKRRVD